MINHVSFIDPILTCANDGFQFLSFLVVTGTPTMLAAAYAERVDNALGEFLRARRELVTPAAAGLAPGHGMRRVAGLRREEVALLGRGQRRISGPFSKGVVQMVNGLVTGADSLILDIYARVSRLGDDRQRSTGGQVDDCTVRVGDHGAVVGEVHIDSGRSAWNPRVRRREWERLMERLESGATGGVVVFDMARFSRRPIEGERLILAAERGLVILDSEGEFDLSTANGRKTFRDQLNAAAYESDRLSTRVKRGKRVKAARGESNHTHRPFGWERDGVTVRESEAAILREMVARILAGESLKRIAVDLNERGVATSVGAKWSGEKVKRVVANPRNGGFVAHLGEIMGRLPGEPLIGESDWDRLTAKFAAQGRGRPAAAEYLCSGLVYCGGCGRQLTGRPQYDRTPYPDGSVRRRYWCQKRLTGGGCNKVSVDLLQLDNAVGALVVARLSDPRHAEAMNAAAVAAATKRQPIAEALATAEDVATQMADRLGRGDISLERYDAVVIPLDRRIAEMRAKLEALDAAQDEVDDSEEARAESVEVWTARWAAANVGEKRLMIKRSLRHGEKVKKVVVMPAITRGPRFDRERVQVADKVPVV